MERDHLNLLCNVNELSSLLAGSADVDTFLDRTVEMVAEHIRAEVCSIYLYDAKDKALYLKATRGLNKAQVNQITLDLSEGLVGLCLQNRRPICEQKASEHPHFKSFEGLDEEAFEAFLAVPIQRGSERIGVLVAQRRESDDFSESDVLALQATASQLAGAIENARILLSFRQAGGAAAATEQPEMEMVKGKAAAEGYARGPSLIYSHHRLDWQKLTDDPGEFDLADFEKALEATQQQLEELQRRLEEKLPEVASMIFGAHLMMLRDPEFAGAMRQKIEEGENAPDAVRHVAEHFIKIFDNSANAYIREKVTDVEDLASRLIANIVDQEHAPTPDVQGKILIAGELFPSELLKLSSAGTAGVILVSGGVTSHVSILARSLQLPMVIANQTQLLELSDDTDVLLDADVGNIYVQPSDEVIQQFDQRNESRELAGREQMAPQTCMTTGECVQLQANINLLSDVALARDMLAEGVGLYRTEFPFLIRADFPSESEQINIYHHLIEQMEGRPVTLRTLDLGGDKVMTHTPGYMVEENPVLGLRSTRFMLENVDIFKEQVRAILQAGAGHENLRVMFPMISSLDEFMRARSVLDSCIEELQQEGLPYQADMAIGMMVEIPSVVELMDAFADVSDFFCIGTNDFIQFMLAVDRGNQQIAKYYQPHHPAILRSLKRIVQTANARNRDVSICGEMAHMSAFIPFLLGIGVRSLSVDPHFLPSLQKQVCSLDRESCEALAAELLEMTRAPDIQARLEAFAESAE